MPCRVILQQDEGSGGWGQQSACKKQRGLAPEAWSERSHGHMHGQRTRTQSVADTGRQPTSATGDSNS